VSIVERLKQVIVVRKDLGMRKGKMCAQVAHASGKIIDKYYFNWRVRTWMHNDYTKVVVGCDGLDDLYDIQDKCFERYVLSYMVTDKGYTEFDGELTPTCIAVGPDIVDIIDNICKDYKLL